MMNGACSLPDAIVTHNWGNLFRDLVAGICADALGLSGYALVSELLDHDIVALESMLASSGKIQKTYWVCAFCIAQHSCICQTTSAGDLDPVDGTEHPTCDCGRPKCFNDTPEVDALGRSVHCELNKFDDMMGHIARIDVQFEQLIVVDSKFDLFTRAWCVAEVAEAFRIGMPQNLKIKCGQELHAFEERLRSLKVQEMEASRPEDVAEILAKIPDKDVFNAQLQTLIFDEQTGLLAQWRILDTTEHGFSGCAAKDLKLLLTSVGFEVRFQPKDVDTGDALGCLEQGLPEGLAYVRGTCWAFPLDAKEQVALDLHELALAAEVPEMVLGAETRPPVDATWESTSTRRPSKSKLLRKGSKESTAPAVEKPLEKAAGSGSRPTSEKMSQSQSSPNLNAGPSQTLSGHGHSRSHASMLGPSTTLGPEP
ncbi:unnamed protein product, partial [Polarella glacialis]